MRRVIMAAPMLVAVLAACDHDAPAAPVARTRLSVPPLGGAATVNATATGLPGISGYPSHIAKGINATGKPVGTALGGSPPSRAESFSPAAEVYFNFSNPPQPTDGFAEEAFSITDGGLITGSGVLNSHRRTYAGGGNWLPLLTDAINQFGGYANTAGEVVGVTYFDVNNSTPGHATLWTPNAGTYVATDLGLFNGVTIEPRGIARGLSGSSRIIVGRRTSTSGGTFTAVIWQSGSWTDLATVQGCSRNETQANGVSDAGVVVGLEALCTNGAALWTNGQFRSLLPECQLAFGTNAGGGEARRIAVTTGGRLLIVGTCIDQPAVWYDDGQGGFICVLLPLLAGDTSGDAYDVNASGQIVGSTFTSGGDQHAVVWTFTIPGSGSQPPNAVPGGPYTGDEGTAVNFNGSGSSDPDNNALTYDWDFGDGSAHGTGVSPSHTYADDGLYTVKLTVDDGTGNTDVASSTATIGNKPPQVNAGSASTLQSGDVLNFSGSFSDPGTVDSPWTTSINWGDGSPATTGSQNTQSAVTASHTYFATGTWTLDLGVRDNDLLLGTSSRSVTVNPRNAALVVSPNPISLGSKKVMQIDVTVLSAAGFDATLIDPASVRLGNGTDPDAVLPQKKNGGYSVTLRDANRDGLRDFSVSFDKSAPNLGLVTPSTSLVLRALAPSNGGTIVIRSTATVNVTP